MRVTHRDAKLGKRIVLIIGGGFAGLNAAKKLSHEKNLTVVIVDQKNHHLFQPLLYQVATAGLNPADIAAPIRSQFDRDSNIEVHLSRVKFVDLQEKYVRFEDGFEFNFDFILIACGARHSYFGHPEWEEFAPGLKTLEQATEIRRRFLLAFEAAENERDETKREALLNFVVVGAGPTGVELAGAIAEIRRNVLTDDFKRIDTEKSKVILLEAGNKILTSFEESLSQRAFKDLASMGVDIRLQTKVIDINAEGVKVENGPFIPSKTVIWAAGVQASPMEFAQPLEKDRSGRIRVQSDFSIPGFSNAFVVGDMAAFEIERGKFLPGLAPAAIQAGRHAALMIRRTLANEKRLSFQYLDKGQMATIGKRKAIAQFAGVKLTGLIAWLGWLFVHVLYLIGFKNKVSVMAEWTWSYLFQKRGSRLITDKDWKLSRD